MRAWHTFEKALNYRCDRTGGDDRGLDSARATATCSASPRNFATKARHYLTRRCKPRYARNLNHLYRHFVAISGCALALSRKPPIWTEPCNELKVARNRG